MTLGLHHAWLFIGHLDSSVRIDPIRGVLPVVPRLLAPSRVVQSVLVFTLPLITAHLLTGRERESALLGLLVNAR